MTRSELVNAIGILAVSTQGAPDPALMRGVVDAWLLVLADVSAADLREAIVRHLQDTRPCGPNDDRPRGRWWPTATDVLQLVRDQDEPRLLAAWDEATRAAREGRIVTTRNMHLIHAAMNAVGGYHAVRHRTEREEATMRARFVEAYRTAELAQRKQIGGGT